MAKITEKKNDQIATEPVPERAPRACRTLALDDLAAEEDLLAPPGTIGPHARIAHALADAIQSGDLGGKMVGLEGHWGSGKTTVINLLRKELQSQKREKLEFFCFDAWAHEGDPLRRTYLESLIKRLQAIEWIKKDKWDDKLLELSHRRKVAKTKTVPIVTPLGLAVAISAFCIPLGLAVFNKSLDNLTIDRGLPVSGKFFIGLVLTFLPPLIALAVGAWMKLHGQAVTFLDWALFFKGEITENIQETTETPQPTSIEFETQFGQLMSEALKQQDRTLVIALDNLDRVNIQDALSIWATLQTFLQHRGREQSPWFKQVCIIVPYDPSGLRKLWAQRNQPGADEDSRVVADSFIDKSFQIRFEVPPLLLSNWKTYLTRLLAEALPEHSEEDRQLIYQVFTLSGRKSTEPTPRELVLYVNQIGVAHRQWYDSFPIGHVAYYAALRRDLDDIEHELLSGTIPTAQVAALFPLDSDLRGSLAGLFYNVEPATGMQRLLMEPIIKALGESEPENLSKLEHVHRDGFWVVLEEIATSQLNDFLVGNPGQGERDFGMIPNSVPG